MFHMPMDLFEQVLADTDAIIANCVACKSQLIECSVHPPAPVCECGATDHYIRNCLSNRDADDEVCIFECDSCKATDPDDPDWEKPCCCVFGKRAESLDHMVPEDVEDELVWSEEEHGCYYCGATGHRYQECADYYTDVEEWVAQDAARGVDGQVEFDDDSRFCSNCFSTSHMVGACPKTDERSVELCPKCYRSGGLHSLNCEDRVIDEMFPPSDEELDDVFFEDENMVLIPANPMSPCYNREGTKFECSCEKPPLLECVDCGVGREFKEHEWRPWREDGEYNVVKRNKKKAKTQKKKQYQPSTAAKQEVKSTAPKTTAPTNNKAPDKKGAAQQNDWNVWAKDRHYGDTWTTYDGSTTFYVSSLWNPIDRKADDFIPDWGLYFDWQWHPSWRAEHIDWPDYQTPREDVIAFEQLIVAIEKAQAGLMVEMGCIGAHGRTGTAMAAINVMLGQDPKEAIAHVRKTHCNHAIESKKQEWWVEWVASVVNGTECPPMPVTTTYAKKTGTTATGTVPACTIENHFEAWLWAPAGKDTHCPYKGASCDYWEQDYDDYAAGVYPRMPATTISLADVDVVDGFLVPKQTWKAEGKPGGKHVAAPTKYNMFGGCKCDVCRYRDAGYEAFLCPSEKDAKLAYNTTLDEMQQFAMEEAADRKGIEIARKTAQFFNREPTVGGTLLEMMQVAGTVPRGVTSLKAWRAGGVAPTPPAEKKAEGRTVNAKLTLADHIISTAATEPPFNVNDSGCYVEGHGLPTETMIVAYKGPHAVRIDKTPYKSGMQDITILPYVAPNKAPVNVVPVDKPPVGPKPSWAADDEPDDGNPETIKIAMKDGTIQEIAVHQEMLDKHPVPNNVVIDVAGPQNGVVRPPRDGDVKDDYKWVEGEGWVLQTLMGKEIAKEHELTEAERSDLARGEAMKRIQARLAAKREATKKGLVQMYDAAQLQADLDKEEVTA